jgi:hypothetical protein
MEAERMERKTIRRIREAVRKGTLPREFTPKEVNQLLRIHWAGVFLPKHRVGNPGHETEHFVRLSRGRYKLKD